MKNYLRSTENIVPKRWDEVRSPNPQEMLGTLVLSLPIDEASAKMRTGAPLDDEEDYQLPVWAGEIPLRLVAKTPIPDSRLSSDLDIAKHLVNYSRVRNKETKNNADCGGHGDCTIDSEVSSDSTP